MNTSVLNVGIIGAGHIAGKIANTLQRMEDVRAWAVASRTQEKAAAFAANHGIAKAYGSYDALIADNDVDLIYIATPHSHHFDVTLRAIEAGKPCLVEKAFMANYREALHVVQRARERHVFLAEAIWTRYQPAVNIIRQLIEGGRIGRIQLLSASIGYSMAQKERIMRPELCGGALTDIGIYGLNFVRMFHHATIRQTTSTCMLSDNGVDMQDAISLTFEDGVMANIQASALCVNDNTGTICGTDGYLTVDNINNPQRINVYRQGRILEEELHVPSQISGYEYEFQACREALIRGWQETPLMPLDETLYIMQQMDALRKAWGVVYPMD